MLKEEKILGVKVNTGLNYGEVLQHIENVLLKDGKTHYICTTNPEFIIDAQSDPEFKEIINRADMSLPDGSGVLFASAYNHAVAKYYATHVGRNSLFPLAALFTGLRVGLQGLTKNDAFGSRIFGVSLAEKICKLSSERGYSVFFLGGWPKDALGRDIVTSEDLATVAASNMRKRYPKVNIIGATSSFSRNDSDDAATVEYIRSCMTKAGVDRLDFLFVAYNHRYQEKWILRNASKLPASVSIGVGGTFDYFAHIKKQSPDILVKRNLDWLYRLFTQPWRFKRVFKAFPVFPLKVFIKSIK